MSLEKLEIRRITEQVLKNQNLWNLAEIYKKEHNIFRGTHKGFASGGISWDAISGKPSTFPPSGHTLASHSTKAHTELTGVTSGQHHTQLHAAAHHVGGGDLVNHDSLTGFVAAEHLSLPNTIANVLSNHTKAVHDALLINAATVGTLAASAFIRANADDNVAGHTEWQDGYQLRLGAGADFRMWHAAPHHYFRSYKHGENLYIQLEDAGGTNKTYLTFDPDVGGVMAKDHGAAAIDMLVNVCYGTGNPPTASTTTIGTLFVKY